MAIQRQANLLGQQRVDVPHLRAMESAVAADFDTLAGRVLAGRSPLVSQGFVMVTTGITQADQLQLLVADSLLIHSEASESGSVFQVPSDRPAETLSATVSTRVSGAFTPSQVNYVGVDLVRAADRSTNDLVAFIDSTTLTETFREVPLARTLDYVIVISTTDFSSTPNIAPIAKVTTGAGNAVVLVEDARNIMWRLGSGGSVPNTQNAYPWPGDRDESTGFTGGDKAITSFKDWADAVMTRLWEQGGGEFWYSPAADRNVRMIRTGAVFAGSGEHFEWDGTHLHWKGLKVVFDNSFPITTNIISDQTTNSTGLTNLADGECIYVDINRAAGATLFAAKAVLSTLGTPTVPGSRWVIAWRVGSDIFTRDQGFAIGSSYDIATTVAVGSSRLSSSDTGAGGALAPRVTTCESDGGRAVAAGLTRGDSSSGVGADFFLSAGPILIGGYDQDEDVEIATNNSAFAVLITGIQQFATGRSTLEVANGVDMLADPNARVIKVSGYDGAQVETSFIVEAIGSLGHRMVAGGVVDNPAPTATDPIAVKTYWIDGDHGPLNRVIDETSRFLTYALSGGEARTSWTVEALRFLEELRGTYFTDFTGETPTGATSVSGGGTVTYSSTLSGGVFTLSTPAGGATASWSPSGDGVTTPRVLANGKTNNWDYTFRAKLGAAVTAATQIRLGWTGGGFDGLEFQPDGTLRLVAGGVSAVLVPWTPDTAWHTYRVTHHAATSTIKVYIDGVLELTDVTAHTNLNPFAKSLNAAVENLVATNQILHIDKAFCAFPDPV